MGTREAGPVEWTWDDQLGPRQRRPACLIITEAGNVHRFYGRDIPGIVRVLDAAYVKDGDWSHTTFTCVSGDGSRTYQFRQDFQSGEYWPQSSWEDALADVRRSAPQVNADSLEFLIRSAWRDAAKKFDDNRAAIAALSAAAPQPQAAISRGKFADLFGRFLAYAARKEERANTQLCLYPDGAGYLYDETTIFEWKHVEEAFAFFDNDLKAQKR